MTKALTNTLLIKSMNYIIHYAIWQHAQKVYVLATTSKMLSKMQSDTINTKLVLLTLRSIQDTFT